MGTVAVLSEIEALGEALDEACDALLTASEQGLALTTQTPLDRAALAAAFSDIMALCAFQDLAGQRLRRLSDTLAGAAPDQRADAALLHGPANGDGVDQATADALFNDR